MNGAIVREMSDQSEFSEKGITGWITKLYWSALFDPIPVSQSSLIGTLMRLAIGLASFFASSTLSSARAGTITKHEQIATNQSALEAVDCRCEPYERRIDGVIDVFFGTEGGLSREISAAQVGWAVHRHSAGPRPPVH